MPYIKIHFDFTNGTYFISNKTDGTNLQIADDNPSVKYFNEIKPPHIKFKGLENYPNSIFSVSRNHDPLKMVFSSPVSYYIKI